MAAVVELLAWYRSSPPPDTKWGHIFSEGDGVLVHPGNLEVKSFIPRKEESSIQSIFSDCKTFIDGGVKDDDENTDLNDYKGDEAVGGLDKVKLNDPTLLDMMTGVKSHSSESATVRVNGEEDEGGSFRGEMVYVGSVDWVRAFGQASKGRWVFAVRWEQGSFWICP
ncbi:hypothetical protein U1Q18_049034 [Sarracenia purpurea var. burkii]